MPGVKLSGNRGLSPVLFFIMTLALPGAHADQCEYFDEKAAKLVQNIIKTGDVLLDYCEPCDMPEPLPLRVHSMRLEQEVAPMRSTNINGIWYSYEEIKAGEVPGMSRHERNVLLESLAMANPAVYHLVINDGIRDLAYLYYRVTPADTNYRNIGVIAGCADGVSPAITYKFPDKSRDPVAPDRPHFEDISGVCFDGSCLLDSWKLNKQAELRADHEARAAVTATLSPGEKLRVERIVSEVIPVHANVVFDQGRFQKGDEFYVLNSLGEGYFRVWYYGRIVEEELLGVSMQQMENGEWATCPEPNANCWAEAEGYPQETWWALVQTGAGKKGWLREPEAVTENIYELQ